MFVNNTPCMKPEHQIAEGDRLTVRGISRARGRSAVRAVKDEFSSNMSKCVNIGRMCPAKPVVKRFVYVIL
ncbi:MAG: hypothetical protein ACLSGI_07800 [Butyricicoccaceae bacterium]